MSRSLAVAVLCALASASASAAPPTRAQCEQAQAELPSHVAWWRGHLAARLELAPDALGERVTLTRSDVICWNEGIVVDVHYTVRYGWAEVAGQDRFPVLHTERRNGTPIPRPRFLTRAQMAGPSLAGVAPAEFMPIAPDRPLAFASAAAAEAQLTEALQQQTGRTPTEVRTRLNFYVPGRVPRVSGQPWLLMQATLDAAANRCGIGQLNLMTGERQVSETPCRVSAVGGVAPAR